MTLSTVDLQGLQRLLAGGAQLVEVLPVDEYEELHLRGAINIPLKQLDATSAARLDPERDVVVYCWDALCDMSPRAAARLETLGFTQVHDYAASKVDWLAHGLPVEGTHAERPTAGSLARKDGATCELTASIEEVRRLIDASPYGYALVLTSSGVVLGRIRRPAIQSAEPNAGVESLIEPGPWTIRPHLTVDELQRELARTEAKTAVVTTPGGALLGVLRREDVPT